MTLTPTDWPKLEAYLTPLAGGACTVHALTLLSGGAIQENYRLVLEVDGGEWPGRHDLVLRRDSPSAVAISHSRAEEYALLKAAYEAGVKVPQPCLLCEDQDILGGPFFIMHFEGGETAGHKLVKAPPSARLVREIGANLARLHAINVDETLAFLSRPTVPAAEACIAQYRSYLDQLPEPHPAVEWGLTWCAQNLPPDEGLVLCHRDYRTGNLMVDGESLVATLDWEFAGFSSPLEDIGWFTAKCWRFGRFAEEAGGLGPRQAFYDGYEDVAGRAIDRDAVTFWEVMATIRWAVIALQQAHRHTSGAEQNLELALTAHIVPELEYEILMMTAPT